MKVIILRVDDLHEKVIEAITSALSIYRSPLDTAILHQVIDQNNYRRADIESVYYTMSGLCEDISNVIMLAPGEEYV